MSRDDLCSINKSPETVSCLAQRGFAKLCQLDLAWQFPCPVSAELTMSCLSVSLLGSSTSARAARNLRLHAGTFTSARLVGSCPFSALACTC